MTGERPSAALFRHGEKATTLKCESIAREFVGIIYDYVAKHYR